MKKTNILAYTVSYGDRNYLKETIPNMRGTAGVWFDWLVCLGSPSTQLSEDAQEALDHPQNRGIQYLQEWPENRGQHHATAFALNLAREQGYDWLLRIDDDLKAKTKRWLKKLISYTEELRKLAGDKKMRIVASPKIMGLKNPLQPVGIIELKGIKFNAEAMDILGGACRLHPVEFLKEFKPKLYAPLGRQDPQALGQYIVEQKGIMVRFPEIRMVHRTEELESKDSSEQEHLRMMGHYWPYLGLMEAK